MKTRPDIQAPAPETDRIENPFTLTVLGSGSSGNCSLLSCKDTHVLIDAGFSGKEIQARMKRAGFEAEKLTAILVTHEHYDHIQSAHTLSRRLNAPILCTAGTYETAIEGKKILEWQEVVPGRSVNIGRTRR